MSTSNNNSLQLPDKNGVINMSAPMAIPQKLSSSAGYSSGGSGSATGNPRNKCALKPGHSLMDWIRLGNSGVDLAGTQGRVIPVSNEELVKHNKVDDAWMAIRGKVFNVTRYMDFHPGGVDELMRGVGRDATKLFDEVHAWVNYPQLLGKCYIGPFKHSVDKPANDIRKSLLEKTTGNLAKLPFPTVAINTEVVPRFDWIQQRSELTIYIYTRQFANPGVMLVKHSLQNIHLHLQIDTQWHHFDFDLQHAVVWPPKAIKIGAETGKVEIVLCKAEVAPWTTYGAHKVTKSVSSEIYEERYDFEIVKYSNINLNSFEISCQCTENHRIIVPPIGYHIAIETSVNGSVVQRSYTPVYSNFCSNEQATLDKSHLNFFIKSYNNGNLSQHLQRLQPGAVLQISVPRGCFRLHQLAAHRNILLLAAGSGLTPFLNMIEPLLKRNTNRLETLRLMYFNKTEQDIWIREKLSAITKKDERFECQHVLSQADGTWSGATGRISQQLLAPLLTKGKLSTFTYIAVCGPTEFNTQTLAMLKELNFKTDNVHIFQG